MNPQVKSNEYLMNPISCDALFSPEECQAIQNNAPLTLLGEGAINAGAEKGFAIEKKFRETTCYGVQKTPENAWISQRIMGLMKEINQNYYHFQIQFLSLVQLLEYTKDSFYSWHTDTGPGLNSTRKLSCIIFLTKPSEYQGGKLLIQPGHFDLAYN